MRFVSAISSSPLLVCAGPLSYLVQRCEGHHAAVHVTAWNVEVAHNIMDCGFMHLLCLPDAPDDASILSSSALAAG